MKTKALKGELAPPLGGMRIPDLLHASTIRSTVARASAYEMAPPVLPSKYRLIQADDLAAHDLSPRLDEDVPLFAHPDIHYRGEPLGLIVGPDPALCDELAASIPVRYEEREPEYEWESPRLERVVFEAECSYGDVRAAFDRPARIDRATYRSGIFDHHYAEPMGALATWEYDKMAVYCGTQWPDHVRRWVSSALGVPEPDILVRPTAMGFSLEGRLWYPSLVAAQAAIAARLCGAPVRILYTREEDYLFTPKQARSIVTIKSATDDEGRLTALDIDIVINIGAYSPLARELVSQAMSAVAGMYSCPNIQLRAAAVSSDILPLGAMGSLGTSHAFFSIEAHINHLARTLGKAPAEIKTINMLRRGQSNFGAPGLDADIPFQRIHGMIESLSDYRRKYASYELVKRSSDREGTRPGDGVVRGIALTVGYQTGHSYSGIPGMNRYSVETTLDRDLSLTISTQAAALSESARLLWGRTAASVLAIPETSVRFASPGDPASLPCGPLTLSRGVSTIQRLVDRSCKTIQRRRFRESLPLVARAQTRAAEPARVGGAAGFPYPRFDGASWCGTAVELEIDPVTGKICPLGIWMVVDAGGIYVPEAAVASLRASALNALAMCLCPEFIPGGENPSQYREYSPLRLAETPPVTIDFVDPHRDAPPRGIGELPFVTVPAAFYSALTQALGAEPRDIPLSESEILGYLEKR